MPRQTRVDKSGFVYHVLNRAVGRRTIFETPGDYRAFENILEETCDAVALRILAYTCMPNHWHFVARSSRDGDLARFFKRLSQTHAQRWHAHHGTVGTGHLYQDRFKSFPIQSDAHLLTVLRYVERNALTANLVGRAEHWRWSSMWRRQSKDPLLMQILSDWPIDRPGNWIDFVNRPLTGAELGAVQTCIARNRPYGNPMWVVETAERLGLESTLREPGRPNACGPHVVHLFGRLLAAAEHQAGDVV